VDSSLTSVKLELSKLNTFFDYDAKSLSTPKPGVLHIGSATAQPSAGIHSNCPNGHHVESNHRDCGFGRVYTQTHDPVMGTVLPSPPNPPNPHHASFVPNSDPTQSTHSFSQGSWMNLGKLPKVNFPKFEGENMKLCQSRCENYFDMYSVESSVWV
jgi:hypothetical protein